MLACKLKTVRIGHLDKIGILLVIFPLTWEILLPSKINKECTYFCRIPHLSSVNNSDPEALRSSQNIWDLQVYNDKVLVGFESAEYNSWSLDLYFFNPDNFPRWKREINNAPTEAIEKFRIYNGELIVPNVDPTNVNNRYQYYDGTTWNPVNSVPNRFFAEHDNPCLQVDNPMFIEINGNTLIWSEDMNQPIEHHHFYSVDYLLNQ